MLGEMFPGQDPQRHVTTRRIDSNAARFPAGAILRSLGSFRDPGLGRTKLPGMIKAICEWMLSFTRRIKQRAHTELGSSRLPYRASDLPLFRSFLWPDRKLRTPPYW